MAVTHEPAIYRLNIYHGENLQMHFGYFNPDASEGLIITRLST